MIDNHHTTVVGSGRGIGAMWRQVLQKHRFKPKTLQMAV